VNKAANAIADVGSRRSRRRDIRRYCRHGIPGEGAVMTDHLGGCLCGKVRYAATGPLREVVFCHCAQCRRQTGLYFAATAVDTARLTLTGDGAPLWFAASPHARRGFCGTCGTVLFWRPTSGDYTAILAGSLDDPSVLRPGYHICTEGRAAYYAINDGLPQHARSAPGLATAPQG
jgi:hypothetical protein